MTLLPVKKRESPHGALARFHDELDGLVCGFFGDCDWPAFRGTCWPAIDIVDHDNEYIVKTEKAKPTKIKIKG
jgi:hypothetical protein